MYENSKTSAMGMIGGGAAAMAQMVQRDYTDTPARTPEVVGELERLGQAVEVLAMTSERLCARLSPVLRPTGALNGASGNQTQPPQAVMCGVASTIRDRREAIERYTAQLQQAMSELEV